MWEYNTFVLATQDKQKNETAIAIITGYYSAYYMNGGKKAKSPNELIKKLYTKKQSLDDGLRDIAKLRELENRNTGE